MHTYVICTNANTYRWMLGTGSYKTQSGPNLSVDVTGDDFNLLIPLPPPPECWEHSHVPLCLARRMLIVYVNYTYGTEKGKG